MTVTHPFFRAFLALLAVGMSATAAHVADSVWMLDCLMPTLARNKSGHITFTETKTLSITAQPIELPGELVSVAPDHLEKHTLAPKPGHLVIDGGKLTMERNQRKLTIPLSQHPELGAFVESIRATLAGNRYTSEMVYKVAITGHGDNWALILSLTDTRMQQVMCTTMPEGTRNMLRSVAIRQANDDHSLMHL